jgi:hypothetical protein
LDVGTLAFGFSVLKIHIKATAKMMISIENVKSNEPVFSGSAITTHSKVIKAFFSGVLVYLNDQRLSNRI